jgi:glycosyltransferase involved in cell wall biosynthesis
VDFSVIVPTRNRPEALGRCLEALAGQEWKAGQWEVIVVDDEGEADLEGVVARYAGRMAVRLMRVEHGGPGAARNAGARAARGRWLAFTDDDCLPDRGWLAAFAPDLAEYPGLMAGGTTLNGLPENPRAEASQLIAAAAYRYFNADPRKARFFASNNMVCERETFLRVGGFDERFRIASEDRELTDRWRWLGHPVRWVEGARVRHCHNLTLRGFVRQHFNYGRGAARYHRLRVQRGQGGRFSDLSFRWNWGKLLVGPALRTRYPARMLGLLVAWQAANTAGFLYEEWRIRRGGRW